MTPQSHHRSSVIASSSVDSESPNASPAALAPSPIPIPLTDILCALEADRRRRAEPLAVGDGEPMSGDTFLAHIRLHIRWLRNAPQQRRWGLCCEDAYHFAVAALAMLHEGRTVVMPPNAQPGTLAELANHVDGVITDSDFLAIQAQATPGEAATPREIPVLLGVLFRDSQAARDAAGENLTADMANHYRDAGQIELFTSGTTGEARRIGKTVGQLADEVAVQSVLWCNDFAHTTVVGSVSHQHIYGLLFRVLVPLTLGRPFERRLLVYPDRLSTALQRHAPCVLISCPAHLERFHALADMAGLRDQVRAVVSSGSLLDGPTADVYRTAWGLAPIEVLGSTETGGVAWRRQSPEQPDGRWRPLPSVQLRLVSTATTPDAETADAIEVQSPWATAVPGAWQSLGDRASVYNDGDFVLLGRHDRIVKIGGKRLSLAELEHRLCDHPYVAAAATSTINTGREVVVAALVLTPAGHAALAAGGRRTVTDTVRQMVATHLPTVHLPKRWRIVDTLPRDAQGKTPTALIRALFDDSPSDSTDVPASAYMTPKTAAQPIAETRVLLPEIHSVQIAPSDDTSAQQGGEIALRMTFSVPADLHYLQGHFPGFPVLAGVVQLHWIMHIAQQHLGAPGGLGGIDVLKFHSVIVPGDRIELHATWQPARSKLAFTLTRDTTLCSSGRLVLRATGSAITISSGLGK